MGRRMSENSYDAVVIGSGLGGLTAGALLAKSGRKVCVIERNHSVGGAASAFKKGALTIEPALHQTPDPRDPTETKHAILTELGLLDEIEWVPVRPFYSVKGGPVGQVFDMPVGFDAAHHALSQRFPQDPRGFGAVLRRARADPRRRDAAQRGRRGTDPRQARPCRRSAEAPRPRLARLDRRHARALFSVRRRRPNARSARPSTITPTTPTTLPGRSSPWRRPASSSRGACSSRAAHASCR